MSEAAWLELGLRSLALGFCALSARLLLDGSGRIALETAVYGGVGAFGAVALGGGVLGGAGAVLLAAMVGAGLGGAATPLDAPRGAALGLLFQLGAEAALPRLPAWTGGHMGLALEPVTVGSALPAMLVGLLGLAAVTVLIPRAARVSEGRTSGGEPPPPPAGRFGAVLARGWARARLSVEAPALGRALGLRFGPLRAAVGAVAAATAGAGGVLWASGLEHLHGRSFGLGLSLDALAVALVSGRWGALVGVRALGVAAAWVGLGELWAGHPEARTVVLVALLGGGAYLNASRERRSGEARAPVT